MLDRLLNGGKGTSVIVIMTELKQTSESQVVLPKRLEWSSLSLQYMQMQSGYPAFCIFKRRVVWMLTMVV